MDKSMLEAKIDLLYNKTYKHTPSLLAKSNYFYVQTAGHFIANHNYFTRREGYKSYLLLYTVSGKGFLNYRDKRYELSKGQLFIIDCGEFQEYHTAPDSLWEIKWVHFNGCSSEGYFNSIYSNCGPVIDMKHDCVIPSSIDAITGLLADADLKFEIKASCIIMQMLTSIMLSQHGNPEIHKANNCTSTIEGVINFIEDSYSSTISLADMAALTYMSTYHFSRVFKRATGYSPYEYLTKFRINKAKSLLTHSNDSIEEISRLVGFESVSNFIRTFKEIEGITPLKYRKFWIM